MHRTEIIDGTNGLRTLTESEVAMVGGGSAILTVGAICSAFFRVGAYISPTLAVIDDAIDRTQRHR